MENNKLKEILDSLGAVSYGSNLAGGKIYWTDVNGSVVAHAETKALLSWAATNNSAMWAHAIGQFQDANVPVIKPSESNVEYIGSINDSQAAEYAEKVAKEAGAQFVFRAANGANGLYLALFNFKAESIELSKEDIQRKRNSSIGYIVQMIGNLAEILNDKKRTDEAISLMQHFSDALNQQIEVILKDDDLMAEAAKLQKSIAAWISMLPDQRRDVLAFMKQAASKWNRMK
jgi:hypothetical protein